MLNDEVGTYSIVAALEVKPDLPLYQLSDRKVQVELNQRLVTGNIDVINTVLPDTTLNLSATIEEVKVSRPRDAVTILAEEFGIECDEDWLECIEKPDEIWSEANALADKVDEEVVEEETNNFSFGVSSEDNIDITF